MVKKKKKKKKHIERDPHPNQTRIQFVTNLKISRKPIPKHLTCTNEAGFAKVKLD